MIIFKLGTTVYVNSGQKQIRPLRPKGQNRQFPIKPEMSGRVVNKLYSAFSDLSYFHEIESLPKNLCC